VIVAILAAAHIAMAGSSIVPPDYVTGPSNSAVTQENLSQTVCSTQKDANGKTWVHDQRPSTSYTDRIKKQLLDKYYPGADPLAYELDHDVSIEAGGDPRDPANLWLEPWHMVVGGVDLGAKTKDVVENRVHKELCTGNLTLVQARAKLVGHAWVYSAYEYGYIKINPLELGIKR
jgi:hypothetical protein